jgi:outer membrane receptor protein involved in Fe transport
MERIELLKNGGAVTYGTDAIAGVWNYITRDEFEGLEINVMHQALDDSDGDNTIGAIWGVANEDVNWVTSVEWEERNVLSIPDRDLATYNSTSLDDPEYWPLGRSSFGNPGTFNNYVADGGNPFFVDPGCGEQYPSGGSSVLGVHHGASGCGYSYMPFANIIDDQERIKVFSQAKFRISDKHELYGEVLWSRLETVYEGSPSYPPTNPDAGNFTWVPTHNPGFDSLLNDLAASGAQGAADAAIFRDAGGAHWWGRSLAGEGPAVEFFRRHETMRIVGGLRGDLTDWLSYDLNVNYSDTLADIQGDDVLTERWNHSVSGFGGALCDRPDSGSDDYINGVGAGQGDCQYIFPVSMAIGASPGDPYYNDPALRDWFTGESSSLTKNRLMVTNLVLTGGTGLNLPGGEVLWAAGGQYRWYESQYNPTGDNRVDGPDVSNPFHFLTTQLESYLENRQWAMFAEGSFPITSSLDVELGLRFEDYDVDNVVKPKIAARWDATDWLAFRVSYEEVFRTPIIPSQENSSLELYGPSGEYLQIVTPIPDGLDPEESDNFNIGVIFNTDNGLTATLDYYSLDLTGPFSRETATCECSTKITKSGLPYDPANPQDVSYILTELINGDGIKTDGIDFELNWAINSNVGIWDLGTNLNYVLSYDVGGELNPDGTPTGNDYDAVGFYNVRATALPVEVRSMPEYKANFWAGWSSGNHFTRLYLRYIDKMKIPDSFAEASKFPGMTKIDDHVTLDLHYSYTFLNDSMRVGLSVLNLTDEDPPVAPHEQAYDAYTHNPLGRQIRLSLNYRMGGS